jgi:hypothetical protein
VQYDEARVVKRPRILNEAETTTSNPLLLGLPIVLLQDPAPGDEVSSVDSVECCGKKSFDLSGGPNVRFTVREKSTSF